MWIWVKYYQELYSQENIITNVAFTNIEILPIMEELDELPTAEELSKAINSLACGKAQGKHGIPCEVFKTDKQAALL